MGNSIPSHKAVQQQQVEARIKELAETHGVEHRHGSAPISALELRYSGGALAMNSVFGKLFDVSEAEAADPAQGAERAKALQNRFIFDDQTPSCTTSSIRKASWD